MTGRAAPWTEGGHTARMGLNIKVNLRRAGLGYELAIAEKQRSQRGVMGSRGDQLSGGWIAL